MADSRQTKIVTYKLQGDTTDLMSELQAAVSTLDALDQKLTSIAAQARTIGGKNKNSLGRAAAISTAETQIERLRHTLDPRTIETVSPDQLNLIKQMNAELTKIVNGLGRFKSEATVTKKALDKTATSLRGMNNNLRNANITISETTKNVNDLYSVYSKFILIRVLINYFLELYSVAADYVETMNLFNVATKGARTELSALAEEMADAYNTDIAPIKNSIAVFRQYVNTMGFVREQANILSEGLTKITYDLSSLYNTTYEDMTKAVKSGLAGQTKSLMQYGISVHKATLEQYALNLGLEKSWSALSETEKVALRYIAILDQASSAQGDLARTLESPSNQLKIAKAQVQVFIRNLGALVTLVSQHILPVFNGLLIAVNGFVGAMAEAAGYEIPDYSDNLNATNEMFDEGTESVEEYEDAVKGLLAPMDEINQASNKDGDALGAIDPAILAALESYDNLMSQVNTKTDILAEAFSHLIPPELSKGIGKTLGVGFEAFAAAIDLVTQALATASPVLNVVLNLLGYLLQGASWLLGNVVSPVLTFIGALTSNIWLLVAAFAALNLAQLAATGNWKSMTAVKIIQWFGNLTTKMWANTSAALANVAASIKAKVVSLALAAAIWWETAAWWQKAIAVIAAAGALALVVGGIVIAATSAASAQSQKTMNSGKKGVPAMAKGGVVSAPTLALIGEGRYREAVVPLGNSPQFKSMKDDIANEVLQKIGPTPNRFGQPTRQPTPVILNLNGREIARALLPDLGYAQPQTGVKLTR